MTNNGFLAPKKQTSVDKNQIVWCPLCDWHANDSMTSRRKMGEHIGNAHAEEVRFPQGQEPPDLESEENIVMKGLGFK